MQHPNVDDFLSWSEEEQEKYLSDIPKLRKGNQWNNVEEKMIKLGKEIVAENSYKEGDELTELDSSQIAKVRKKWWML
jgi:hypothetical protein